MGRKFEDTDAVRDRVPLLIGLVGPSSSGKTYSALRLATGIQRVVGGDIYGIDTESNRMKFYAWDEQKKSGFRFRHLPFSAPFSPLDYLEAVDHCIQKGAKTIIIDSFSHEHIGEGGVLEIHDAEAQRLATQWHCSVSKTQFPAWAKPKAQRLRLLNSMVQRDCNFILCFRAKEKVKPMTAEEKKESGGREDLQDMGWMPLGGDEYLYEMTARALLPPNSDGIPVWRAERPGEKLVYKLPEYFRDIFAKARAFDEDHGEAMAKWAAGPTATRENTAARPPTFGKKLAPTEWAGRPLADAPPDVLLAYRVAVFEAAAAASGKAAQQLQGHLATVDAVLAVAPAPVAESATAAVQGAA